MDIICLILLWKVNGKNALLRGQKPRKYQLLTVALLVGLEFLGTLLGMVFFGVTDPESNSIMLAYICGIIGAVVGGVVSYQLAKNAPQGDYTPDMQNPYGSPYGGGFQQPNPYNQGWNGGNQDLLMRPASVRIIAEPSFREGTDDFFLNGRWVCRLAGGSEYTLFTSSRHNIVTVGSPGMMADNNVKFIAADGGFAEIHTQDGRILPERFKNYTAGRPGNQEV